MFSSRVAGSLEPNRLTREIRRARASGRALIDLTTTNPTAAGFDYPPSLLTALGDPAGAAYEPQPLGSLAARAAVSGDYRRRGFDVPADRIVLTASTSEAYSILFKLLCDPVGDAVLTPVPSYPLFDHLTALDGVTALPYPLDAHDGWAIDFPALDERWRAAVRAVLAVSPNNPTGSALSASEIDALGARCAARGAALVIDEVFADYPLGPDPAPAGRQAAAPALTIRLGGLSKSIGLPQVKLGWMALDGPAPLVADALARLELICDTYLSVATPVQVALPRLLAEGAVVRTAILERVRTNYAALRALPAVAPAVAVLDAAGGWSAVVRVPAIRPEEDLVLDLLAQAGVLVHPGFFFDFPHEAFLVVSLLAPPAVFNEGLRRLAAWLNGLSSNQ